MQASRPRPGAALATARAARPGGITAAAHPVRHARAGSLHDDQQRQITAPLSRATTNVRFPRLSLNEKWKLNLRPCEESPARASSMRWPNAGARGPVR